MTPLVASLAALAISSDPGFAVTGLADHCVPFVREDLSVTEVERRLSPLGFVSPVSANETWARFVDSAGNTIVLMIAADYRRCEATQVEAAPKSTAESIGPLGDWVPAIDAIEMPGWSPMPRRTDDFGVSWLSRDGRAMLRIMVQGQVGLASHEPAPLPPDAMIELTQIATEADHRSPGDALIWAFENLCAHQASRLDTGMHFKGSALTDAGVRYDIRQRDPSTFVFHMDASHCFLGVAGAAKEVAAAELVTWLDRPASGWRRTGQAQIWSRDDMTITIAPGPGGRAIRIYELVSDQDA